jgi:MFS family permease
MREHVEDQVFYGWLIVGAIFVVQLFMVGFFTYGFPLLVDPVQREFDSSVTDVMLGISIAGLVGAVVSPIVGPLVDRWSARSLIVIGTLSLIAGLLLMSISQGVYQFAIVVALLLGPANVLVGPITGSTLVSRWFSALRGRALGIAATGTSVGGLLVPLLLQNSIASMGWRDALQLLAGCVAVLVLPLMVFALRNHPSDLRLHPDGVEPTEPAASAEAVPQNWTTGEILRSRSFWLIGTSLGLLFLAYIGALANLHKYATELGVEAKSATHLIQTIAVTGFIGKLVFGWAADRISLRLGLWFAQGLAAAGIAILSLEPGYPAMALGASLMGLAAGGMLPVWGAMVGAAFGVMSFGRAMGLMMPLITAFVVPGPILAALSMDHSGSYTLALQGFVAAVGISAMLLFPLRPTAKQPSSSDGTA